MNLPQISVVHNWRNEKNKSGLYSVYLRITIHRESQYYKIPVPLKVSVKQWCGKDDNWVKDHPFYFKINSKIIEKKSILNELIMRSYNLNKPLNFENVFNHLKKKGDGNSFFDYMKDFIANPPERLEINTIKKYNTCLSHLKEFRKQIYFSDIDNSLLKEFYKSMQVKKDLQGVSCKKYMEAFKRVIRAARKDNYPDASQMEFLFDDVRIKVNQAKRTFLEVEEIKKLKSTVLARISIIWSVTGIYSFSRSIQGIIIKTLRFLQKNIYLMMMNMVTS